MSSIKQTIVLIITLLLISSISLSKSISKIGLKQGTGIATTAATLVVADDNYACITSSSCVPAIAVYKNRFYVKLSYKETNLKHYASSWNLGVTYTIRLYDQLGNLVNTITPSNPLKIDYDPAVGMSYTDIDYDLYDAQNYLKAELDINSINNPFGAGSIGIPSDIHLELVYESEQYSSMNLTHAPVVSSPSFNPAKAELTTTWPSVEGAESYDFEWLFIDIGANPTSGGGPFNYDYDFNNASRINISQTVFTISMAYPRGFLLFRTRAVQTKNTSSGIVRIEGNWSTPVAKGTLSNASGSAVPYSYPLVTNHPICTSPSSCSSPIAAYAYQGLEESKNWQYSVTFAEQGKSKQAITYFDGTLRNRQQVTVSSTEDRAIVGETIYDYVGRPAVNTLPAPQEDNKGMRYYEIQNLNKDSKPFNYTNFDTDGKFNNPDIIDTNDSRGSAYYYSKSNSSPFGINDQYIPTAKGYSYTRVQYKNDGTNRVKKQSGVGETFKIGNGKETQYLYGKPTQEELDRLFGNEAGYANMYKKNAVVDPNGQASISYIDNYGRTIATALSGEIPKQGEESDAERLLPIDTRPHKFHYITSNLSQSNRLDNKGRMVVSSSLTITAPTLVDFSYQLNDTSFYQSCLKENIGCYYDYEIFLTNEYGDKMTFTDGKTIKSDIGITGVPTPISFSVNLEIGTYQIHKILQIHQPKLDNFIQQLSESNACLDVIIDSVTTCNPSCEEACWSGAVSISESGDTSYLDDNGNLVAIFNSSGVRTTIGLAYKIGNVQATIDAIRVEVAACIQLCENIPAPALSTCEVKYQVLKNDMSPGGQYFDALGTAVIPNGWLISHIGANPPNCMNATWDDVRNGWNPDWADILVQYHPEFCAYAVECYPLIESIPGTSCVKIASPYRSTGSCGTSYVTTQVANHMQNYLGTGIPASTLFDITTSTYPSIHPTANTDLNTLLALLYNPTNGIISVQAVMTSADFLKSTKEFYTELVKYNCIKNHDYSSPYEDQINCTDYTAFLQGINGITSKGFHIRYPENPVFESFTIPFNAAAVKSNIQVSSLVTCNNRALELTNEFMESFACKATMTPADNLALRNAILNKAQANCTANAPVEAGLDIEAKNWLTSNGYPAGCMSGSWFQQEPEQCECDNLFTFLADANQKSLFDILTNPSYGSSPSASVLAILDDILSLVDNTNGINTTTLATNLSAWYTSCKSASYSLGTTTFPEYFQCYKDSLPSDTNDCVTAINELAYQNELARIRNQVIDSITKFRNRYTATCLGNIAQRETFTVKYLLQEYHYTLYYYDQAGNLIKTVPPEGVYQLDKDKKIVQSSTLDKLPDLQAVKDYRSKASLVFIRPEHIMATNYRYNSLNQLTSQYTPDGGSSHFFYDKLGRLVASQNADQLYRSNLIGKHIYSFTNFDKLGRMIKVGEIGHPTQLTEEIARNENLSTPWLTWLQATTSVTRTQIVETFYDDQTILSTTVMNQDNLRNRIATVTYDKDGIGGYESASHYTYDINGNVKSLIQENKDLTSVAGSSGLGHDYKRIDYHYDLVSGNVNKVAYQSGKKDEFYHKYEYDADNRLTTAYTSRNNVIWEKESKNLYYAHGPLARTEIGDKKVQGQDYAYTLQGWLKTINSSMGNQDRDIGQDANKTGSNKNFARDVYGFSLHYFRGDYQAIGNNDPVVASTIASYGLGDFNKKVVDLYNGNISAMIVGLTKQDNSRTQVIGNTYRYDQLNRIKEYVPYLGEEVGHAGIPYEENTMDPTKNVNERYNTTYAYDGNGNIENLNRKGSEFVQNPANPTDPNDFIGVPVEMDEFNYHYLNKNSAGAKTNNQLGYVFDAVDPNNYTDDLDEQQSGNYAYDKLGRLISDAKEKIDKITWNVANKITKIEKDGGNQIIEFTYDPMGNRLSKKDIISSGEKTTYYVRDAQGNVMATYGESTRTPNKPFNLNDFHIYGSSRLGTKNEGLMLVENNNPVNAIDYTYRKLGNKRYELSNHLGNVLQVVSDRKLSFEDGGGNVAYFEAEVISYSDYYPFGMLMPNRHGQDDDYRYGFNGHESDNEVYGSEGSSYDFGARMYDPRIGKFKSTDPWEKKYAWQTPYAYYKNSPISTIDWNGLGGYLDEDGNYLGDDGDEEDKQTRVINKDLWKSTIGENENGKLNDITTEVREKLQTSVGTKDEEGNEIGVSKLLTDYESGISISENSWKSIIDNGGTKLTPTVENKTKENIFYKPENTSEALSIEAGKDLYTGIDGLNVKGSLYKVPNEVFNVEVNEYGVFLRSSTADWIIVEMKILDFRIHYLDDWKKIKNAHKPEEDE